MQSIFLLQYSNWFVWWPWVYCPVIEKTNDLSFITTWLWYYDQLTLRASDCSAKLIGGRTAATPAQQSQHAIIINTMFFHKIHCLYQIWITKSITHCATNIVFQEKFSLFTFCQRFGSGWSWLRYDHHKTSQVLLSCHFR